ncbi:RTA1-domain-containing protein [Penicillium odoratum]|uniref:RTA1-domain-containing protein n=1 Tax=Penicillium odoratum TaxID=1167516 RepID=UPI002547937D|nr:RTA1-domain-containing protein [Penicillium odoratum]KAJ5752226.1 RTA1-domain-containing protein [Penicillium odoratum]
MNAPFSQTDRCKEGWMHWKRKLTSCWRFRGIEVWRQKKDGSTADGSPVSVATIAPAACTDVIDQGLLTIDAANVLLKVYQTTLTHYCPFVIIPPQVNAQQLRREKPLLFLAIINAALYENLFLQRKLEMESKKAISECIIGSGKISFEVLQGLLVHIAWCQYHSRPRRYYQYLSLAISVITDLQLDRPPEQRYWTTRVSFDGDDDKDLNPRFLWRLICLRISQILQKRFYFLYLLCLESLGMYLAADTGYASDRYLMHIVELQGISEKIAFYSAPHFPGPHGGNPGIELSYVEPTYPFPQLKAETNSDSCILATCPITEAYVYYFPSLADNAFYLALFAVFLIFQLGLGIRYKTWGFSAGLFGGLVLEIIGYAGRLQMHDNPFLFNPYLEYLVCLTIGPAFFSASIYICLGRIVKIYRERISLLQPRTYTIFFVLCDLISLILQAAGGAITSIADSNQHIVAQTGVKILIAGLATQVASLVLFIAICLQYAWSVHKNPDALNEKPEILGLALATVAIFTRSVFRVAELKGGFHSSLANNQVLFMVFEGAMIVIAILCLTILHPGVCFEGQ